jgi:hypothetical protein
VGETERKRQRGEAEVKSGGKRQKGADRGKCKELSIEVGRDRRRDRREKERERNREGVRSEDSKGRMQNGRRAVAHTSLGWEG